MLFSDKINAGPGQAGITAVNEQADELDTLHAHMLVLTGTAITKESWHVPKSSQVWASLACCVQICARGIHNGRLKTAIVLCYYRAGDRHRVFSSLRPSQHDVRPLPVRELPLYELNEQCAYPYALAVQEHIVCKINSVIAHFNGNCTITVENDAWVNAQGYAVPNAVVRSFPPVSRDVPAHVHFQLCFIRASSCPCNAMIV
jgi:hypothetical protein